MSKSWFITGGSSGIGLSLGRAVLKQGHTAVLTTRNIAKAQQAAPDIEKNGGKWVKLDHADSNLEEVVKEAVTSSNVDVLVNNASYALVGAVEDCTPDIIRTQYEANFIGPIRVIQTVIPFFRHRKSGTIVNIGSAVSYSGMPGNSIYGSSKAAMRTLTEALTGELSAFDIRVILFEPGRFRTKLGENGAFAVPGDGFSEAYKGTPVEQVLTYLRTMGPSPGDPDLAALRIYEVVTRTGMGAGENVKDRARFPLGPDAVGMAANTSKDWSDVAEAAKEIASSTDFKE